MAGHAAGDRVDCVLDVDTALLELVGELADRVLRLRDRQAVARDDDHPVRVGEHHRHVLGGGRAHRPAVGGRTLRSGGRLQLAERAEEDVRHRAAHRAGHHQRQQGARRPDEHAADDQDVLVEDEAGRGGGDAGEGVQQRDDDRHVGAADRQHEQDAEGERAEDDQYRAGTSSAARRRSRSRARPVRRATPGCRPAGPDTRSAARRSARAAWRRRSGCRRTRRCRSGPRGRSQPRRRSRASPGLRDRVVEVRQRDQRRRAAADAVEQRHHLRNRGHLHGACGVCPDGAETAITIRIDA